MLSRLIDGLYFIQSLREVHACFRTHLDVVLWKLIAKLQAFSKCIQETSMVRFYSSIDANDEMLIRQRSRRLKSKLILGGIVLLSGAHDI
jgi:hypothetical protein